MARRTGEPEEGEDNDNDGRRGEDGDGDDGGDEADAASSAVGGGAVSMRAGVLVVVVVVAVDRPAESIDSGSGCCGSVHRLIVGNDRVSGGVGCGSDDDDDDDGGDANNCWRCGVYVKVDDEGNGG